MFAVLLFAGVGNVGMRLLNADRNFDTPRLHVGASAKKKKRGGDEHLVRESGADVAFPEGDTRTLYIFFTLLFYFRGQTSWTRRVGVVMSGDGPGNWGCKIYWLAYPS